MRWLPRLPLAGGYFCGECKKIQPIPSKNLFEYIGVESKFALNDDELKKKFRDLQMRMHPDKFAHTSDIERSISGEHSRMLNTAMKTLGEPLERAKYLLETEGRESIGEVEKSHLAPEELMEVLDWQESVAEMEDESMLQEEKSNVKKEIATAMKTLDGQLTSKDWKASKRTVIRLQYLYSIRTAVDKKIERTFSRTLFGETTLETPGVWKNICRDPSDEYAMCRAHHRFARKDPCSCANGDEVQVSHYALRWHVHFPLKMLIGSVTLTAKVLKTTQHVWLDVRDLSIRSVTVCGKNADFRIAPNVYTFFGSRMKIYLPVDCQREGQELEIVIDYSTSPDASALQWMKKEQTQDKKAPYLFSQCQAIHARSIMPCMDTPSIKSTYDAQVTVPAGSTCLMSAINEGSKGTDEETTFFFKQPVAIPSYLLAIVVGVLAKRDISDRCAVWAEPSMVEKAHWEFNETEDILATAEKIAGKYIWGRYDMVCLPPTFPFGGMENPCLTFLTPTLISGDRSLVSVIAHEIAHSWSGNLVTNKSWEHFWLNEGFTMFIERKICGRLVNEKYRQFMSFNGWTNNLIPAVYEQFNPTHQFTRLIQDHENVDPDVAFSCVPYEKGSALLFYLEQKLGGPDVFEPYLRDYLSTFAHKAIDSFQWKDHLYKYFHDKKDILDTVNFDQCSGLRPMRLPLRLSPLSATKKMQPLQQIEFLSQLWQHDPPLEHYKLEALDALYKLNDSQNCEIVLNWIRVCIKAKWEKIIDKAIWFVESQGRLKYCRPVYRALYAWPVAQKRAKETYLRTRSEMHPITAEMIAKELHVRHSTHTVCF
ncbi:unnamed protein product, partial [Mesorhabditis spiculigera]